jgi:multiple sugar transport system substrate-binding protein
MRSFARIFPMPNKFRRQRKKLKYYIKSLLLLLLVGILALSGCQNLRKTDVVHLTLWQGVNPPPNRDVLSDMGDRVPSFPPTIGYPIA